MRHHHRISCYSSMRAYVTFDGRKSTFELVLVDYWITSQAAAV